MKPSTEEQNPEAAGERRFSGWRGSLNRLIWRAHIFIAGSLVVWVERLFPNQGYGHRIFSSSARLTNRLLGIRVEVLGLAKLDRDQAYVFTPNHRSHVDVTALLAALPAVRFAAKRELFDEPVLGAAMRAVGMIPIDRDDPALAKRTLDEAAAKLGRTVSVVIFPEGTRAPAGRMLPLKGGAFVFAIEEQVPVVPVALHNTAQVMPAHGYLTILGGRVVVEILDPIPTAGLAFEDRHRLQEQVHQALVQALRPEDGGVADRRDLGSFAGHAFGVHVARRDGAEHVVRTGVVPRVLVSRPGGDGASVRPNVTVIGAGSWGTTLASMCARHGSIKIWALEDEVVEEINARHSNSLYLKGFELPAALRATRSMEEATRDAEVVVLAVPSPHFRAVLEQAAPFVRRGLPVVSVTKGLEPASLLRMTEVIAELLPDNPRAVLSGPNLAREIMAGYAAGAVVACRDADIAKGLQGVFNRGLYRVYTSADVVGVEMAGALKNVIAIAAGMADGVGVGDNTRGLVISRGLAELTRLGVAMGGEAQTFAGLAGLGDLLATCISPLSRNRRVGEQLGKGRKLEEIVGEMRMVAEGVHTCRLALELGKRHGVEMPITREIDRVVRGDVTALQAYRGLVRRPPGPESG